MDRKSLKTFTHNAKDFLTVRKNDYKQWVFRYTFLELDKDLGENGDITSSAVIPEETVVAGDIYVQEDGVLAGIEELKYFLVDSDPRFKPRIGELQVEFFKKDGDSVKSGEKICKIIGLARDILAIERVSLNLLMRMSGVATKTAAFVKIVGDDVLLTPTRKTLWGLLDKKAVSIGGGGTHRLNLSDAILIKDNHLSILGGSVSKALKSLSGNATTARFIEIEVETEEDALKAAEDFNSLSSPGEIQAPACVMLDNFSPAAVKETLAAIKDKGLYEKILFEASGGITSANLAEYAATGVDIISMGELTNNVKSLNFHLEIGS